MATIVKLFLVPGSVSFLVAGLLVGLALLYAGERARRWGRAWLTLLLVVYAFLATPLGADWVSGPLTRGYGRIASRDEAKGIDTIVVLSNGGELYVSEHGQVAEMGKLNAFNVLEAARLYGLLSPAVVVASGGIVEQGLRQVPEARVLADGLARLGVPAQKTVLETRSRTTYEQAVNVADIVAKRRVRRFVLVTTPGHMPRAAASFRRLGLVPVPSVPAITMSAPPTAWGRLRPRLAALQQSDWACYEYLARVYYWKQGWLGVPTAD